MVATTSDPSANIYDYLMNNPLMNPDVDPEVARLRALSGKTMSSSVPGINKQVHTPMGTAFATSREHEAWSELVAAADQHAVTLRCVKHMQDHRTERLELVDISGMLIHRADNMYATGQPTTAWLTLQRARGILDVAIDVGLAITGPEFFALKSAFELAMGHNLVTGVRLSGEQQAFNVMNVLMVGTGESLKLVQQAARYLQTVAAEESAGSKVAGKMLDYLKAADQAARRERARAGSNSTYPRGPDGPIAGANVGSSIDQDIRDRFGNLKPQEWTTAAHFGCYEGVEAMRNTEIIRRLDTWGIGKTGMNQAPVHLFASGKELDVMARRWSKVEQATNLKPTSIARILARNADGSFIFRSAADIEAALTALDDAAELVISNATDSIRNGKKEVFWREPQTKESEAGLIVHTYDGKKQTVMVVDENRWLAIRSKFEKGLP